MNNICIKIQNLKKEYTLGTIGGRTLNAELQSWWARLIGKEDPNSKIGEDQSRYGEKFLALNNINLEISKGEAIGIIGGNGAGKSTLLKILSRVTAPTDGDIWINGRIASMLEVGTGFHNELTGRENIYMNGAILGMTKREVDSKIESIIDFSECRQFIDTPVKRYSSGMYVKLAFAVASHLDSEIMIMDEVLAVGDVAFQNKCLGKMGDEAESGKTILYVSHNMSTIRNLCSRCIVLNKGNIIYDGTVDNAISVYMGTSNCVRKVYYEGIDLQWPKKNTLLGNKISINCINLINKTYAVYDSSEKILLNVKYSVNKFIENLYMGIQLYSQDLNTIGFGNTKLSNIKIGDNESTFELDISYLAEGVYCFRLNIHILDNLNKYVESLDQTNYIYFDVTNSPGKLIWKREWWNNIRIESFKEI